ncbi:MAG: anti-sigma factor [bacterium]
MTHDNYKELITARALTALDAADTRDLQAHLETCAECRAEANQWDATAALLAFEATPIEPSPLVRERILTAIHAENRPSVSKNTSQNIQPAQSERSQSSSTVVPFERPEKNVRSSVASYYAIAASVALVALAISLFAIWQQNRAAKTEIAKLSAEMRDTQQQLAHEREVLALITTPGSRMTELAGTNVAPDAHAMIAYDKTGHAMLMAKGLPAAPAGKAYQLWYIMGSKPMPGRVFATDTNGNGSLQDQVPAEAMSGAVFAITLEPAGGVQSPTGAIYLKSGV